MKSSKKCYPLGMHNHAHCLTNALTQAEQLCQSRGIRLTPLRKQVLEALWQAHQARGAYDILASLKGKNGRPLAPLSVYRALDFLVEQGLAHRVESLNAYIGCPHPTTHHALHLLICSVCHTVQEVESKAVTRSLTTAAQKVGFTPERSVVEVLGRCASCA